MSRVDEIWERMNDSERYGVPFGLFPAWVQEYELTHEETVELMGKTAATEAKLLEAIAKAPSLSQQRRLTAQLDALRQRESARVAQERELDLGAQIVRDTLTPVRVHDRHTAATDWLDDVEVPEGGEYTKAMRAEAALWFRKLHTAVRADRQEYAEQAQGMADILAGRFGTEAAAARRAFLDEAGRLFSQSKGDSPGKVDHDQSGNAESTVTDYDTKVDQDPMWAEDYMGEDDTGSQIGSGKPSEQPGAGESTARKASRGDASPKGRRAAGRTASQKQAKPPWMPSEGDRVTVNGKPGEVVGKGSSGFFSVSFDDGYTVNDISRSDLKKSSSKTAMEGETCAECGDPIAKTDGEWHHDNGEKHDHEAKPSGGDKESRRKTANVDVFIDGAFSFNAMTVPHAWARVVAQGLENADGEIVGGFTGRTSFAEAAEKYGTENEHVIVGESRRRTAGVYCKTHQVWVGDENADTHSRDSCDKEQRATEKTKDARRKQGYGVEGYDMPYHVTIDVPAGISSGQSFDNINEASDFFGDAWRGTYPEGTKVQLIQQEGDAFQPGTEHTVLDEKIVSRSKKSDDFVPGRRGFKVTAEDDEDDAPEMDDDDSDEVNEQTNEFAEEVAEELAESAEEDENDSLDNEDDGEVQSEDDSEDKEARLRRFRARVQRSFKDR